MKQLLLLRKLQSVAVVVYENFSVGYANGVSNVTLSFRCGRLLEEGVRPADPQGEAGAGQAGRQISHLRPNSAPRLRKQAPERFV